MPRHESENTAGCQISRIIVHDHREHARSCSFNGEGFSA